MTEAFALIWPQPIAPIHTVGISALVAALPLILILLLMGVLRKSGMFASLCGLGFAGLLAALAWHMPLAFILESVAFGFIYAVCPVLWIVFGGLWLYNLTQDTGKFDLLRRWMEEHASGDRCIQVVLVAFCFGALLEGSSGFGAPVAVTACLLAALNFEPIHAVVVALIANTSPVAFGGLGIPIVVLAGVTGLDLSQLSAMAGRQVPFLSFILPFYLALLVGGGRGLKRTWPAVLVAAGTFALVQFLVSNVWGPYATDVVAASASIAALVAFISIWKPGANRQESLDGSFVSLAVPDPRSSKISSREAVAAWLPWVLLAGVMILWSYLKLVQKGQFTIPIHGLHNGILITLYNRPYSAIYSFQTFGPGTAAIAATVLTAICFAVHPRILLDSGWKTVLQLRLPGLTVIAIVGLAFLYNYSGMAYTLGAAVARVGTSFPL